MHFSSYKNIAIGLTMIQILDLERLMEKLGMKLLG